MVKHQTVVYGLQVAPIILKYFATGNSAKIVIRSLTLFFS